MLRMKAWWLLTYQMRGWIGLRSIVAKRSICRLCEQLTLKKNAKGEMEYEIKETYIDENGVKRERIVKK